MPDKISSVPRKERTLFRDISPLNRKIYSIFPGGGRGERLPGFCLDLLSDQEKGWPDLLKGYESLGVTRERSLSCRGFSVRLQYNPGRIRSSTAAVGEVKKESTCFLCPDRLPEGQKGILYREEYLILCNPMPIFSHHFTVSHIRHRPQALEDSFEAFLHLMADLSPGWTVLYNGPDCGASAPGHLHFQIVPSRRLPVEEEIREENRLILRKEREGILLYQIKDLGRTAFLILGGDASALRRFFSLYLRAFRKAVETAGEPMMNLAGLHQDGTWRLLVFPRGKHRPGLFFEKGEARIVISPGVIDMGGVIVTPVERDFERVNAERVETIYREVTLDEETVRKAVSLMDQSA